MGLGDLVGDFLVDRVVDMTLSEGIAVDEWFEWDLGWGCGVKGVSEAHEEGGRRFIRGGMDMAKRHESNSMSQ